MMAGRFGAAVCLLVGVAFCTADAGAQAVPLSMNLYADIGGAEIGPGEQSGVVVGQTVRYRLVADMGDGPGAPYFGSVTLDLVPFDCGEEVIVTDFAYGDWADVSTPPDLLGGAIIGIDAAQFGSDLSNPVEVCTFEAVAQFGLITYTAVGTGLGGEAFRVGLFDSYGVSVFDGPRVIAVGGPGDDAPCNAADMAEPFGVLDLADIQRFVTRFTDGGCRADLSPPWGVVDLGDLAVFVASFVDGCE